MESQIVKFDVTSAALAELRKRYEEVPDVTTKQGYALVKAGLSELTKLRTGTEARRVELKGPSLQFGRDVDAEAARITGALKDIEEPLREAKTAEDEIAQREKDAEIQAEQERIDRITQKIDNIRAFANNLSGATSGHIKTKQQSLCDTINNVSEGFYAEYTDQANRAIQETEALFSVALAGRLKFENEAAENERVRLENEATAAKQKEAQDKLDADQKKLDDERQAIEDDKLAAERAEAEGVRLAKEKLEREAQASALRHPGQTGRSWQYIWTTLFFVLLKFQSLQIRVVSVLQTNLSGP